MLLLGTFPQYHRKGEQITHPCLESTWKGGARQSLTAFGLCWVISPEAQLPLGWALSRVVSTSCWTKQTQDIWGCWWTLERHSPQLRSGTVPAHFFSPGGYENSLSRGTGSKCQIYTFCTLSNYGKIRLLLFPSGGLVQD
jgi:hypothetical protein